MTGWTVWPREGTHVNIVFNFGHIALSSADHNWHLVWEES